MTTAMQYVRKVGGSLMVTIPREVAELEGISSGEIVEIEIHKVKKDWFGAFPQLHSLKKEEKLDLHD